MISLQKNFTRALIVAVLAGLPLAMAAQTLTITNGVQTYATLSGYTVNLSNRCELRVTSTNSPLSGCTINLNSADSFLVDAGLPSVFYRLIYQ